MFIFADSYDVRYFKFESVEAINSEAWLSVSEIGVLTKK